MQEYFVPTGFGQAELVEKKSTFTGRVFLVETEVAAQAEIKKIRDAYKDANHHVFAYVLKQGGIARFSDDGEPRGTGGAPVLNVLTREKVENILCVVTRYFGGTLLGAGGLTRAYGNAAKIALDAAGISVMRPFQKISCEIAYGQYDFLLDYLQKEDVTIVDTSFGETVTLVLSYPEANALSLQEKIVDNTNGKALVALEEITLMPEPVR